ncbi:hypothetical protein BOO69_00635 [Sulfitobacter alexandrii]|uniref:Type II secretion system protein M n=1 Tax=Sulfitobacter alexandrii TaxID=1917485 RepID=A0A1J0WD43_9RHOB|nr:type II secretion system protein GspM [Sulfitobacter alexandrii]APE42078.1 hypothetical protein BOO69_00635 [Sulfitobacter alexandrii]
MNGRLIDFLLQRSARERLLLAVLFGLGLPLLIVFAVLLPLKDRKAAALAANTEAVALNIWVQERAAELASLSSAPVEARSDPIGSSAIEESLIRADLRPYVSELGVADGGVIELRFDLVKFTALADWISANSRTWGYDISSFRFEASQESGKVSARLSLAPAS